MEQKTPVQPIRLRILFGEEQQWMMVNNHLAVCPGNGCSVDVCLYIRSLCAHDVDKCIELEYCSWCAKVQRWLKYHTKDCTPKKCPYYQFCHETRKKIFKLNMRRSSRRYSDHLKELSPSTKSESSLDSLTIDTRTHPVSGWETSHEESKCCDDGGCCHDPLTPLSLSDYMSGAFSQKMVEICQKALDEELPVTEAKVKEMIDTKHRLRLTLLQQHQFYKEGTHWERIRRLGCGSSGTTYCIRDMESAFWLALKEEQDCKTAVDETAISLRLSSAVKDHPPNIVEFYGASLLSSPADAKLQLFLELMPCCLQSFLFNGGPLTVEDSHNYCCQLFDALDFLHTRMNLVHSDIKPGNLLIDENIQRLKVADFGCAQVLEDTHDGYCMRGNAKAGTLHYNPPEHYNEFRCSYALDIWQAGCCFVAMVTGRRPWRSLYLDCRDSRYRANAQRFQTQQIAEVTSSHLVPGFLDSALRQLVESCVQVEYGRRPNPRQCLALLVSSEVVSDDCKSPWLSHLGMQPTCITPSSHHTLQHIDIYLGSHVRFPFYSMLPGWLGSVSCDSHMTYNQIFPLIYSSIPVTQVFGPMELALCDNSPRLIWQKSQIDFSCSQTVTSSDIYGLPRLKKDNLVDFNKGIVLIVLPPV